MTTHVLEDRAMSSTVIVLILVSIALSSGSQLALKLGMTSASVQLALEGRDPLSIALAVATSPLVVGGLITFGLSAVAWLFVLSQVPLSTAYPFVALGIVATAAAGYLALGETITVLKLMGVMLIVAGITIVGLGS